MQVPLMGGRLVFKVMDEDTLRLRDEIVGSIVINAKDFIQEDGAIVNIPDKKGKVIEQLNYDLKDEDRIKAK